MTDQDISGKWVGEYVYGEEYGEPISGKRIPFEIDITCTNGHVKGNCVDDDSKHFLPQPATIEGIAKQNSISFIKRYPCLWQKDEHGDPHFFPKLPSQEIHYAGLYSDGKFQGGWEVVMTLARENGDGFEYTGTGSWYMHKV